MNKRIRYIQDTSLRNDLKGVYFEDSDDLVTSQKGVYEVCSYYFRYFKTKRCAEDFLSGKFKYNK